MIECGVYYGVRTLPPEQTLRPKRTLRPIVIHTTIFQINGRNVRFGRKVRFGRNVLRRIVFGRIVLEPYITPKSTVLKPSSWFEKKRLGSPCCSEGMSEKNRVSYILQVAEPP